MSHLKRWMKAYTEAWLAAFYTLLQVGMISYLL